MKALGAKKWDILVKIGIPRSMPYLFASLKVAITLAYVGSVIAEFERLALRHRQPHHARQRRLQCAAGVRRADRARHPRRHHLRRDRGAGAAHDRLGPPFRHGPGVGWVKHRSWSSVGDDPTPSHLRGPRPWREQRVYPRSAGRSRVGEKRGSGGSGNRTAGQRRLPPPPRRIFGLSAAFKLTGHREFHPRPRRGAPLPRLRIATRLQPRSHNLERLHGATLGERGGSIIRRAATAGIAPELVNCRSTCRRLQLHRHWRQMRPLNVVILGLACPQTDPRSNHDNALN